MIFMAGVLNKLSEIQQYRPAVRQFVDLETPIFKVQKDFEKIPSGLVNYYNFQKIITIL